MGQYSLNGGLFLFLSSKLLFYRLHIKLFFANTRVGMKPRPLTQYLFSRQFPTGQAFANEASKIASEHASENGWIACIFDSSKESLLLDWIPNNEMNRGLHGLFCFVLTYF